MTNVYKYVKDTYKHVPDGYCSTAGELMQIVDKNNGSACNCIFDAWKLGFEKAYRAAKAGKLDFQQ